MFRSILFLAASAAAASTSTPSSITKSPTATQNAEHIWVPLYSKPKEGVQASIIAAGKDMTTYALGCGIDAGLTCEAMFAGQTLTRGPSTAAYIFTYGGEEYKSLGVGLDLTQSVDCTLQDKSVMACYVTVNGSDNGTPTNSMLQFATVGYMSDALYVTVTGGADKLEAAATATGDATTGGTAGTSLVKATGEASADGTSSTAAAASSTNTDNGVGAFATQNAFLAGAAMMVGGAAVFL